MSESKLVEITIKQGKYELEYRQFIDDMGAIQDLYEFKTGFGSIPLRPPMKAKDYTPETNIMVHINEPTLEEMKESLDFFIKKYGR